MRPADALDTPVAFLVFRRPDTTARVFERIRAARPRRLFLIADGPRPDRPEDREAVERTRAVVDAVDWECDVRRNYAEENMGLRRRISSGLDWVFGQADRAIVLEDDCIPDPTFFRFADELLERYAADYRIMSVRGTSFHGGQRVTADSYHFSRYESCWGWATWARAWRHFDLELSRWPALRDTLLFRSAFSSDRVADYWEGIFSRLHNSEIDSWAYAWTFAHLVQNGLAIVPEHNLVSNAGFRPDGTHTLSNRTSLAGLDTTPLRFPLRHPTVVMPHGAADRAHERRVLGLRPFPQRLAHALTRRARRLFPFPSSGHRP